jgi:Flp pilus assembly protein TadD
LIYLLSGDNARAIEDYTEAIRLDPANTEFYSSRASVYAESGDDARAIEDYSQAIRLEPANARFYAKRALAYYLSGESARAIEDFTKAIRLGLAYDEAHDWYRWLNRKEDYGRAVDELTEAIRFDPANAEFFRNRSGDNGRAIEDLYRHGIRGNGYLDPTDSGWRLGDPPQREQRSGVRMCR